MSERWGFDLSMEAVRLMRHRLGEWQEFDVQKLEDDNIEARLADLVAKVETPASVDIFLPRDQILFTDVKVSSDTPTTEEIYSAMDGRTPYDLADLEIDWVATGPGTARVAAIATQTLNEAEAFVTGGDLTVRTFSSLADPKDFPRAPIFCEREAALPKTPPPVEAKDELPEVPAFSSARTTPPPLVLKAADKAPDPASTDSPVVLVDDPTPVLQLPETDLPPLNPGAPLPRPTSEPRVVTNIGASAAEARAASLTATPSIAIRHRDRAVPTPALIGVAAALSIGVAIIIWSILPSTPESSLVAPETVEAMPEAATEVAEISPSDAEEKAPEISPLPVDIVKISDTPTVPALPEVSPAFAWISDNTPASEGIGEQLVSVERFASDPLPKVEWLEPRPNALAMIDKYTPVAFAPTDPDGPERPDFTFVASLEPVVSRGITSRLLPPFTGPLGANPALDTRAPDAFVAPVIAETTDLIEVPAEVEETELAALDPVIADAVVEPAPQEPVISAPAPVEEIAPVLVPTDLAAALPDTAPRARPSELPLEIEREKFGGRTRDELAKIRPGTRPRSAQIEALVARAGNPPSELAVGTSITPRDKPSDFDALVAAAVILQRQEREAQTLAALTPDTSGAIEAALADERAPEQAAEEATKPQNSPRLAIPSNASVARQATIEDALRLNRINLVGIFGRAADRRALLRLPSGRYVKVKIGDRVDGGTVAGISDTTLQYQKGGRTVSLTMPQG